MHRGTCKKEIVVFCDAEIKRQSRIIDATYLGHISSTTDIKLLGLLKEIIAIKYLDTTLFSKQVLITYNYFSCWLTTNINYHAIHQCKVSNPKMECGIFAC